MENCELLVKGIVRSNDKVLIVGKWFDDCISNPYQWQFIDGTVEYGESPDAAVLRLIAEQTGLAAEISHILYTWTIMVGDIQKVGIAYDCISEQDTVMLSEDLNASKWITKEEIKDYIDNENVIEDLMRVEF